MFRIACASMVAVTPDVVAANIACRVHVECNVAPAFAPVCYTSVHKVRAPLETMLDAIFNGHRI